MAQKSAKNSFYGSRWKFYDEMYRLSARLRWLQLIKCQLVLLSKTKKSVILAFYVQKYPYRHKKIFSPTWRHDCLFSVKIEILWELPMHPCLYKKWKTHEKECTAAEGEINQFTPWNRCHEKQEVIDLFIHSSLCVNILCTSFSFYKVCPRSCHLHQESAKLLTVIKNR